MKSKVILLSLLTFITYSILTSCDKPISGAHFSQYLIHGVTDVEDIELSSWVNYGGNNYIRIKPIGELTAIGSERTIEVCEKYGDTHFNQRIVPFSVTVIADEFTSISVISDEDFDAGHPAGTPLDDIVRIMSKSCLPFIESDYKAYFDWHNNIPEDFVNLVSINRYFYPVNMALSELQPDDLKLLQSSIIDLKFTKEPEVNKTHNMTVTLRTAEKVLTGTVEMVFE